MAYYQCTKCRVYYPSRKDNFYKKKSTKTGYDYHCKKCNHKLSNNWYKNQSQEKKEETRLKNVEIKRKSREDGNYKETIESYKPRRNAMRREQAHYKRQFDRLSIYVNKYYWSESSDWYLPDIKFCEL